MRCSGTGTSFVSAAQATKNCKKVESLLTFDQDGSSVLDRPIQALPGKYPVLTERYEVLRELGRGGMSMVYLAKDHQLLDRSVVVIILLEETSEDAWLRQKFMQEMEALSRIDHSGVVGVLDTGLTGDGRRFLVMQYVEGVTLRSLITPGGHGVRACGGPDPSDWAGTGGGA